jgi:hypothetical protein
VTQGDSQSQVELVWNKGIAALCDRRVPDEFPGGISYSPIPTLAGALTSRRIPDNLISDAGSFQDIGEGELVWVRLSWLRSFIKQVLPLVKNRFLLATSDSDSCVPSETMSETRQLLQSNKVLHWYAQNYDGTLHSKAISPLPIGIDFHTLSERPIWGESITTPLQQEAELIAISAQLPKRAERLGSVYVDFAWQQSLGLRHYRRFHPLTGTRFHESRRRLANKVREMPGIYCQSGALPRSIMWRQRGQYVFVLSPHGMGLDCHRTWEALALGHIVLVPSSSLDSLYEGLPVIPLSGWGEITPDNLARWRSEYPEGCGQDRITSKFWVDRMRAILAL